MTRTLILMRHAEAHDGLPADDKARLLTRNGHSQAQTCGRELRATGHVPEIVIHSTAKRIIQTRDELMTQWFEPPRLIEDARLYTPPQGLTDDNLLHFFSRIMDQADDTATKLMVLGHTPELADVVRILNRSVPTPLSSGYPSATACVFSSSAATWYEVGPANSQLEMIVLKGEKALGPRHLQGLTHLAGHPSPTVT